MRTPQSLVLLLFVVLADRDRVVCVVRLVGEVCDRKVQLIDAQPANLISRRESESVSQVEQDVGSLRDAERAIDAQDRWRKVCRSTFLA